MQRCLPARSAVLLPDPGLPYSRSPLMTKPRRESVPRCSPPSNPRLSSTAIYMQERSILPVREQCRTASDALHDEPDVHAENCRHVRLPIIRAHEDRVPRVDAGSEHLRGRDMDGIERAKWVSRAERLSAS